MGDTLRDKQKRVARELILRAAADEIVEHGLEDLSLQAVADRAGVSKRTLYNYFDTRETLLTEIGHWSDQLTVEMGGFLQPTGLDALPEMVSRLWHTWEAQGTLHEAVLRIDAASSESGISDARRRRRHALQEAVHAVRPDLDPQQCAEIAAVFHAVASAPVFRRLTDEDGLDVDTAGRLASWCITVMRDALADGIHPFTEKETT